MVERDESNLPTGNELVPVVFARSLKEAEDYQQLLEDHGIEVLIAADDYKQRDDPDAYAGGHARGVPVLVSVTFLDEAGQIIADRDDLDEFELADDEDYDDDDEDEDICILESGDADACFPEEDEEDSTLGDEDEE